MSVPNQKTIEVGPRQVRDAKHIYATMNIDALQQAMNDLKGSGLKMWLYFNKNQENYRFELSRTECEKWGIKKDSYYAGIEELEKKGYLHPRWDGSSYYTFYETPRSGNPTSIGTRNWESENPANLSGNPKIPSGNPNWMSENQYRNNTYTTEIVQDNTAIQKKETNEEAWRRLGF